MTKKKLLKEKQYWLVDNIKLVILLQWTCMFRFHFRPQYMYQVTVAYYTSYTLTEYKEKTD